MRVIVYHEIRRPFLAFDPDQATLEEAYRYHRENPNREQARVLSSIWHENNVIEGNEIPTRHEARSLSVGDVIRLDGKFGDEFLADDQPHFFAVEPSGWRSVFEADVNTALDRGQVFDPFEGL